MNPPGQQAPECVLHARIERDLQKVQQKQDSRPCQSHETKIQALEKTDARLEKENEEQWTAINQLRQSVWFQRGAMAVAAAGGSVLGTVLIKLLFK